MRLSHRLALLSACALLALGMAPPVRAADGETVHYSAPFPMELYFDRDTAYEDFLSEALAWTNLYPGGDPEAHPLSFYITWNEADWAEGAAGGGDVFTVSGAYAPDLDFWDEESRARWDAGLIAADPDAPPAVTVHLRPEGLIAVYDGTDRAVYDRTIYPSTTFDEAVENILSSYTNLPQKAGAESPFDPEYMGFTILWDREDYEAGLANCLAAGGTAFVLTGRYEAARAEDAERAAAEGAPMDRVLIRQPPAPDAPEVYENVDDHGPRSVYIAPGTDFASTALPRTAMLTRQGEEAWDGFDRDFGLAWDDDAFAAGMRAGRDFTLTGRYTPLESWPAEERQWWDEGRVRVAEDSPTVEVAVHIVRDEDYPYRVLMEDTWSLHPVFEFNWPNGAEEAVCAISFDKETWYTETWGWDESYWTLPARCCVSYTEDGEDLDIPDGSTVYCKITFAGSDFAGETKIMVLKQDGNGDWELSDDISGDHGGGGQGEHDRPGKTEPVETRPEKEDGSAGKLTFRKLWARLHTSLTELFSGGESAPGIPESEAPEAAPAPETVTEPAPSPSAIAKPPETPAATVQILEQAPAVPAGSAEAAPETDGPDSPVLEETPAPAPVPTDGAEPETEPAAPPSPPPADPVPAETADVRLPGYATAGAATLTVVLCGAALFRWWAGRKK